MLLYKSRRHRVKLALTCDELKKTAGPVGRNMALETEKTSIHSRERGQVLRRQGPLQMKYGLAAAKLLQSCPTLCDPTDGSPPGISVPGILWGTPKG